MLNGMTSYFEVIKEINKESGTLEEARTFFTDSSAQSKLHVFSDVIDQIRFLLTPGIIGQET